MRLNQFLTLLTITAMSHSAKSQPFKIQVVDEQTGRGVPLVELRTTDSAVFYTDSNGLVAFDEPGLMNEDVYFSVKSHGYEHPADAFGARGKAFKTTPGGSGQIKIQRLNIAKRLYRLTGPGIYRDTILVGEKAPLKNPLLNGKVMGQDTIQRAIYKGKIYWMWGDTSRVAYTLGNFHMSGATSLLPAQGGLDPSLGVNYDYFVNQEGFCRAMIELPGIAGGTLIWADAMMVLPDDKGNEHLIAHYETLKGLSEPLSRGLVVFNDEKQVFESLKTLELKNPLHPRNSPLRAKANGADYFYFTGPLPNVRVQANWNDIQNQKAYEAYTPLKNGARFEGDNTQLERDANGKLIWNWKRDTAPLMPAQQNQLIKAGKMRLEESPFRLQDKEGKSIEAHNGSVFWNDFVKKYVMIFVQANGSSSYLGEVWYAESEKLEGPWQRATKIVTHDKYTFYNPIHHPFFDQNGGRFIYFEGTYCNTFSGNPQQTPRYDYNQIMYRLDLADARLR
jgi:hypothetical protein